jgi:WhiB family redox-sensing transcriptional regulator
VRIIRVERPDWFADAVCRGGDPAVMALFFPLRGGGNNRRALAMCADCPVITECRAYALDRPELAGVWGGTTDTDRDRLRRRIA